MVELEKRGKGGVPQHGGKKALPPTAGGSAPGSYQAFCS
jgi:hypothetical protein